VGAWIETGTKVTIMFLVDVAPCVGAWIETEQVRYRLNVTLSRPAWARGLKRMTHVCPKCGAMSRPAWARGLKLFYPAGLMMRLLSRPAWARGLKLFDVISLEIQFCRALRGRVD